jgi:S-DNA-T family DNA segregation ATPase FtsK/SpoIIIE
MTIRDDRGGEQDIAVVSRAPVRLGDLRELVPALTAGPVWSGRHPVPDEAQVGGAGLRHGALLSVGRPVGSVRSHIGARVHVVGGPDAGLACELSSAAVTVGRAAECALVLTDPDVSRRHLSIGITGRTAWVRDGESTNGTRIEGRVVTTDPEPIRPGELIRLGDSFLEVVPAGGPSAAEAPAALRPTESGCLQVNRPPRIAAPPQHDVVLPPQPTPRRPGRIRLLGAVVPAAAGIALAVVLHSPQYLLFLRRYRR